MKTREILGKQTSNTEYVHLDGYFILIERCADGIKLCVVGQNGDGCNGKARLFRRKTLETLITSARKEGEIKVSLTIPSQFKRKGAVRTGEENVRLTCGFLSALLRRPVT